jgi:hypothetical protein
MINETNWMKKMAEDRACDSLEIARASLERALHEIEMYQVKFTQTDTLAQKADIINWVINYLATGIYPNLRLDQLASAQAELKSMSALKS